MPKVRLLPGDATVTRNDSLLSNDTTGTVTMSVGDLASFVRQEIANAIGIDQIVSSLEGQLGPSGITLTTSKFEQIIQVNTPTRELSYSLTATNAIYVGNDFTTTVFTDPNVVLGSLLILANANEAIPAISGVITNIDVSSRRIEFSGLVSSSQIGTYGTEGDFRNTLTIVRATGLSIAGDVTITGDLTVEGDFNGDTGGGGSGTTATVDHERGVAQRLSASFNTHGLSSGTAIDRIRITFTSVSERDGSGPFVLGSRLTFATPTATDTQIKEADISKSGKVIDTANVSALELDVEFDQTLLFETGDFLFREVLTEGDIGLVQEGPGIGISQTSGGTTIISTTGPTSVIATEAPPTGTADDIITFVTPTL